MIRFSEKPLVTVVVPCFNEEEVLDFTIDRLHSLLSQMVNDGVVHPNSTICYVDDGSRDRTWEIIRESTCRYGSLVSGIKLSRNCGHQHALMAGMMNVMGDAIVTIDADLQDDILAIPTMIDMYKLGNDVVYGVRSSRKVDSFFKRFSAELYYKILSSFRVEIVFNHADYRLVSRRVIESLRKYEESNLFLRALVPLIGFNSTIVKYDRLERFAGDSKYPLRKMIKLAWDGITSFSVVPLRAITYMGICMSMISFFMGIWALWVKLSYDNAVPGWASVVIPIAFVSGIQMLSLGVIGEYISKIFIESKRRPLYIVEERINANNTH